VVGARARPSIGATFGFFKPAYTALVGSGKSGIGASRDSGLVFLTQIGRTDGVTADDGDGPAAVRIARRVMGREAVRDARATPAALASALQRVFGRLSYNLRDAMGPDGYDALLVRALARAKRAHPALAMAGALNEREMHTDKMLAIIEAHGADVATDAMEALLVAFIDILSRLIGEDMAIRLIDPDVPQLRPNGGAGLP